MTAIHLRRRVYVLAVQQGTWSEAASTRQSFEKKQKRPKIILDFDRRQAYT